MIFDYLALMLDKQAMAAHDFTLTVSLDDTGEVFTLVFRNGALLHAQGSLPGEADLSLSCPKNALLYLIARNEEGISQSIRMEGDVALMDLIVENLSEFVPGTPNIFNIIEP